MKNKRTVRYIFLTLTILNAALIFYLSSQNGEESANTSGLLIENLFGAMLDKFHIDLSDIRVFSVLDHIIRKLAHFSEYALLGVNLSFFIGSFDKSKSFTFLLSAASGFLYACSDELHQYFVPARSAQFTDVLIDTAGVLTGIAIFVLFVAVKSAIKKKSGNHTRK